jgi:hypothetical protein
LAFYGFFSLLLIVAIYYFRTPVARSKGSNPEVLEAAKASG